MEKKIVFKCSNKTCEIYDQECTVVIPASTHGSGYHGYLFSRDYYNCKYCSSEIEDYNFNLFINDKSIDEVLAEFKTETAIVKPVKDRGKYYYRGRDKRTVEPITFNGGTQKATAADKAMVERNMKRIANKK